MQIYSSFWNCFTANKDVDTIKTKNKQTNKQKHIKFLVHVVIVNKPRVNSLQVCWFKNRNNNFYVKTKNNGKKRNSDIICNIYCKRNIYIYSPSTFLQPCLLRRQDIGNCFTVVWTVPGIDTRAKWRNPVHDITSGLHSSSNFLHPRSVKFRWDVNDTLNLTFVIFLLYVKRFISFLVFWG